MKVLFADTGLNLAERITRLFAEASISVDVALNGSDASQKGWACAYDCAIIHHHLLGVSGIALLRRWRTASFHHPVLHLNDRDR